MDVKYDFKSEINKLKWDKILAESLEKVSEFTFVSKKVFFTIEPFLLPDSAGSSPKFEFDRSCCYIYTRFSSQQMPLSYLHNTFEWSRRDDEFDYIKVPATAQQLGHNRSNGDNWEEKSKRKRRSSRQRKYFVALSETSISDMQSEFRPVLQFISKSLQLLSKNLPRQV